MDRTRPGAEAARALATRHIGLDADEHGPMAERLIGSLCGSDDARWRAAGDAAAAALESRRELWDGVYALLQQRKEAVPVSPRATVFRDPPDVI